MTPEAKAQIYILQLLKEGVIEVRYKYRKGRDTVAEHLNEPVDGEDALAFGYYEGYSVVIDVIEDIKDYIRKNGEIKE